MIKPSSTVVIVNGGIHFLQKVDQNGLQSQWKDRDLDLDDLDVA